MARTPAKSRRYVVGLLIFIILSVAITFQIIFFTDLDNRFLSPQAANSGQCKSFTPYGQCNPANTSRSCFLFPSGTRWYLLGNGFHNGCENGRCVAGAIKGYDYMARKGVPILAPFSGRVTSACSRDGVGNTVFRLHNKDYEFGVLHLKCTVKTGQRVEAGQQIVKLTVSASLHNHMHMYGSAGWVVLPISEIITSFGIVSTMLPPRNAALILVPAVTVPGSAIVGQIPGNL